MKTLLKTMVVPVLAAAILLGGSAAAGAQEVNWGGAPGPSQVGQGSCSYMRTNLNGWLRTTTAPPTVWARNNYAGWGNEYQRVRYMAYAVDFTTGATLATTGWSATVYAWDNSPAQWSGSTVLDLDYRSRFQVWYRIEWLDGAGRVAGWTVQAITSYRYDNRGVGPYGPFSACVKAY